MHFLKNNLTKYSLERLEMKYNARLILNKKFSWYDFSKNDLFCSLQSKIFQTCFKVLEEIVFFAKALINLKTFHDPRNWVAALSPTIRLSSVSLLLVRKNLFIALFLTMKGILKPTWNFWVINLSNIETWKSCLNFWFVEKQTDWFTIFLLI